MGHPRRGGGVRRRQLSEPRATIAEGSSVEAGAGVDRKAGSYRFSGTVLFHRERRSGPPRELEEPSRSDLSLVFTERRFARERYGLRVFGVANTTEGSGFVRGIGPRSSATTWDWRHPRLVRRRGP